jgi:Per os infectivity factor 3
MTEMSLFFSSIIVLVMMISMYTSTRLYLYHLDFNERQKHFFDYIDDVNDSNQSQPKDCLKHNISCKTTLECQTFCAGSPFECFNSVCIPKVSKHEKIFLSECSKRTGGIPTLQPFLGLSTARFKCTCMYPSYFSGPQCNKLTEQVCKNGIFDQERDFTVKPPNPVDCTCPYKLIKAVITKPSTEDLNESQKLHSIPICLPRKQFNVYGRMRVVESFS